jgi:hypothetical protein
MFFAAGAIILLFLIEFYIWNWLCFLSDWQLGAVRAYNAQNHGGIKCRTRLR